MEYIIEGIWVISIVLVINILFYIAGKILNKHNYKITKQSYYLISFIFLLILGVIVGWYGITNLC